MIPKVKPADKKIEEVKKAKETKKQLKPLNKKTAVPTKYAVRGVKAARSRAKDEGKPSTIEPPLQDVVEEKSLYLKLSEMTDE